MFGPCIFGPFHSFLIGNYQKQDVDVYRARVLTLWIIETALGIGTNWLFVIMPPGIPRQCV